MLKTVTGSFTFWICGCGFMLAIKIQSSGITPNGQSAHFQSSTHMSFFLNMQHYFVVQLRSSSSSSSAVVVVVVVAVATTGSVGGVVVGGGSTAETSGT